MKQNKKRRIFLQTLKIAGAYKLIITYSVFFFIMAWLLYIFEPSIITVGDSLWYCFAAATTIGFGDIAAVSLFGRILTIILSMYSIAVVAIITAIITNFFIEVAKMKANESVAAFLDDLEHLPELSKEELRDISEKVRKHRKGDSDN